MNKDVHFSIVCAAKTAEVQRERKRMPSNGAMLNKLYITIEQHVIRLAKKQFDRTIPNDSGSVESNKMRKARERKRYTKYNAIRVQQ